MKTGRWMHWNSHHLFGLGFVVGLGCRFFNRGTIIDHLNAQGMTSRGHCAAV